MDTDVIGDIIAANLESLAKEKGLPVTAWAKAAGMSHTGVKDIITRKTKNPTYVTLVKLAEYAGVDVRRITVGPDYMQRDQDDAELLDSLSRLESGERQFLLNAAKAQIASRSPSPKKPQE